MFTLISRHQSLDGHSEGLIFSSTKEKNINTIKSGLEKQIPIKTNISSSNGTLHSAYWNKGISVIYKKEVEPQQLQFFLCETEQLYFLLALAFIIKISTFSLENEQQFFIKYIKK